MGFPHPWCRGTLNRLENTHYPADGINCLEIYLGSNRPKNVVSRFAQLFRLALPCPQHSDRRGPLTISLGSVEPTLFQAVVRAVRQAQCQT